MSTLIKAFSVGEQAAERRVGPLSRTDIVRYAGAGGDFNPIHHDETFAQRAGYPSVFAHGLLTAGILSTYASEWLGLTALRKYAVRYVAQVWPGDTLILSGQVDAVQSSADGKHIVTCSLLVQREANGQRQDVLKASAIAHYAQPKGESDA
ncbi:MaoC/PaaZ C-terminal domain-containing protein [Pseudomonas sp. 5P_3.1_Bac2]|uniref:MaoC/PaaZ C-terminal domain-containing protein n=1 Tax=Pseudomonas sp. 5P_3.1_Bac2 TaxID=2971617 RepID=UPI0021C6061A|nr:MaoC/PaaZ C-terminal domain-containing protein [Pseudomonas sp. 5P_3.1_Bac2]MCU1717671.1 MaoC/PaaZ C-terminal domain-containing protein [Pseudomonas sp. 5P_3.1_Bac2]